MDVSVDVRGLFLAAVLTQMKFNTLNSVYIYILPNFIAWRGKKGEK